MTKPTQEQIEAARALKLLCEEITDREGREGMTDADFAEQIIALAQDLKPKAEAALIAAAQIETAAKAIHALELEHGYVTREWRGIDAETEYMAMAKAALSEVDKNGKDAAAQVGEASLSQHNHVFRGGRCIACDLTEKQIAAAAQVGEPDRSSIAAADIDMAWINEHGDAINRTIERCAQVAEHMTETTEFWRDEIAAAIRKLKDE